MPKQDTAKQLQTLFTQLPPADQATLLAFAEFLHARVKPEDIETPALNIIPRPTEETVIAAVKRLSKSYPMLDKSKMLHEISSFVTQHMIQGRKAQSVIDDLEETFAQHYETFVQTKQ